MGGEEYGERISGHEHGSANCSDIFRDNLYIARANYVQILYFIWRIKYYDRNFDNCDVVNPWNILYFCFNREYSKKVIVKNGSVSYYHWGRHVRTFQKEEITVYGVAQFWARDAYIFYCRASEEEISRYWNTHKKMAKRMFKQYYNSLKESDEKLWQLMVGVYIRKKLSSMTSDIIITGCTYSVGFGEIVKIMNKRPILTGIVLLNDPGAWEDEIKKPGI